MKLIKNNNNGKFDKFNQPFWNRKQYWLLFFHDGNQCIEILLCPIFCDGDPPWTSGIVQHHLVWKIWQRQEADSPQHVVLYDLLDLHWILSLHSGHRCTQEGGGGVEGMKKKTPTPVKTQNEWKPPQAILPKSFDPLPTGILAKTSACTPGFSNCVHLWFRYQKLFDTSMVLCHLLFAFCNCSWGIRWSACCYFSLMLSSQQGI